MEKFYPAEIEEINEAMERNLEIYHENLDDYKRWDKSKKDSFMSKFSQEECDKMAEYYLRKIELVRKIQRKLGK